MYRLVLVAVALHSLRIRAELCLLLPSFVHTRKSERYVEMSPVSYSLPVARMTLGASRLITVQLMALAGPKCLMSTDSKGQVALACARSM